MADNDKTTIYNEQETKPRQSTTPRMKDRMDESRLPTPPPSPWDSQNAQVQAEMSQIRNLEEDEDIIAYLADLGTAFESQTSECPSRNSTTSTIPISGFYSDESFEPLSRLYALTDQILELRDRNSKLFKRVRNLEKLKVLRDADRRLENTFARNKHLDVRDEDTEFAESLLNAMLSNYRDPLSQRRNIRSPSSKQARNKFNFDKQISNSPEEISGRAPKISKWTRVKAAFKWERAFTSDVETMDRAAPLSTSVKNLGIPHNEVENSGTITESCESTKSSNQATTPPTATTSFNEGSLDCMKYIVIFVFAYNIVETSLSKINDQEPATAYSCSDSTENLEKMSALNDQTDTQRDYISLREKLGSEFHRKLIEWERLKSLSPRDAVKDTRDIPLSLLNFQETLLPEERLAPEFRKKLQDWKRAKKERRGSAPLEQQRINRRRLTDWQVWRSPFKSEYKNPELMGMRGSYGNGENICSDGRPRLLDDIVRKVETWKKINETPNRDTKHSLQSNSNQFEVVSGLDESEFLTLERVLSLFEKNIDNARTESDACQSDECFDCDARSYLDGTQNINNNEVLIQTSVGSYRFEGISQEFTRKLYDWEKYRGISPRSSTFRLLGPAYVPFVEETNVRIPTLNVDEIGSNEHAFKINTLKRSKSVSNLNIEFQATEYFVRRAASLNHLTDRLKNTDFINILPTSIDPQKIDVSKDIAIDDSEREAMIVDIEDVIEETASPLERVQPHQTPVYSVAASETTSIAVPLGTVTSTHKSSPMFLVETEKSLNQKHKKFIRWNGKNDSDEDCLSSEQFVTSNIWNNRKNSFSKDNVDLARLLNKIGNSNNNFNYLDQDYNGKRIKEDNLTYSMESNDKYKIANEFKQTADEKCNSIERQEISTVTYRKENASKTIRKQAFDATCRYNQDLPSNDGQRVSGDGCSDDGMDVTTAEMKFDNEYEEIILDDTINPNRRSLTNFNEYSTNPLTDLSVDCKLGETNHIVLGVNSYLINEVNENLKKREENDDAVKIKMDLCHNRNESSRTEETVSAESTQVKEYEQNHEFVNVPISSTVCVQDSCTQGCHHEPTIPTTPLTVSLCREERCLERIIINEETLNKIVVPTASNNCTENLRIVKPSTNGSSAKHFMGDNNRRSSINYETSTDQEMNVKKQCSPTRNVFIKTKRIIFSPFRRVEEHSISKKQNNTSEDDSVSVTKSKNKSRSASPKVNRQDALLRMSFSLPWPLRPTSKDREIKETTDDGNKERQIEIENKRKSFINENKLLQQLQEEPKMQTLKDKQPEENDRVKYFLKQKENLVDVSVQATPNGQQDGAFSTNNSFIVEHGEKKDEVVPPLKLNKCSSDLMHKLQILSSVIAQRDGRTDILSGESCMESHSMRIHRAKQDFLSHRGGPLCHSVMETRSFNDHYEQIVQDRHPKNKKLSLKIEETLDTCKLKKDETKMPVYEDAANGLLENSAVFLPDRVKSASVGMINIDPDTFKRLTESNRGCESLPRTISKQQEPLRPLAKIVNKFKFARLIRGRDTAEGSMSTISRLCKQSLLIDVQNDFEKQWETKDRDK
ncbi:uncharacterized protein LOC143185772 isoform X2 [Calliopsis andreniformis]|uniref:uncharacterized protein LOC143185772 isoform X2 n=1 Tax=Calliopsis andreniformis TaxID=337506 RepID=UPI003FCC925B